MNEDNGLDFLFSRPVDIRKALKDTLVGHFELHLRDAIAQAAMYAVTKRHVFFNVIAS